MTRILRYTILGALGAVIAWAIMEPTPLLPDRMQEVSYAASFFIGLFSGLMVGVAIGLAEAATALSTRDARKGILMGALVGAGGGVLGMGFGNAVFSVALSLAGGSGIYDAVGRSVPAGVAEHLPHAKPGLLTFLLLLMGRGAGWAFLGGLIGLSQGIATGSMKKMINGAIGGVLGGGIGGSVFEILVWISLSGAAPMSPGMIRFISYAITGGSIGLFIGFIEEVAKKAWLVRLVGRNEGKEYEIAKPVVVLGRSELVDLPVFGDPDVAERHAQITAQGARHSIEDLGSFAGTWVNGQKVAKEMLRSGDEIVIGKTRFLFKDKATAGSYRPSSVFATGASIPTSHHLCPFCGAVKDANGACQCTVGGASPTVQQPAAQMGQPTIVQQPSAQMGQPPIVQEPLAQMPQPSAQTPGQPPSAEPTVQQGAVVGARLVAVAGPYSGQTFVLKPGEMQIGRESTKDIGLPMDNTVSRSHARIAQEGSTWVLYDAGSTNGTFVNNARVTRHELANADVIQIGSTKFRFEV